MTYHFFAMWLLPADLPEHVDDHVGGQVVEHGDEQRHQDERHDDHHARVQDILTTGPHHTVQLGPHVLEVLPQALDHVRLLGGLRLRHLRPSVLSLRPRLRAVHSSRDYPRRYLRLAGQEGFEPPTSGFGDRRSTNWSYWPVAFCRASCPADIPDYRVSL